MLRTSLGLFVLGAALSTFAPVSSAQSCDRILGVNGEGVSWAVPSAHTAPAEILASTTYDPDGAGPLPPWLIVAGNFDRAGDVTANNIAAWDGSAWRPLGTGTNGRVKAVAVLGSRLFIGGDFTSAGGVPDTSLFARWTGSAWEPAIVLSNGTAETWAPNSVLLDLASDGSRIYFCGQMHGSPLSWVYGHDIFTTDGTDLSARGCDSHILTGVFSGLDCAPGQAQAIEPRGPDMHVICGSGLRFPPESNVLAYSDDPFNGYNWHSVAGSGSLTSVCLRYINSQYWIGGRAPDGTPALYRTFTLNGLQGVMPVAVPNAGQGTVTAVAQLSSGGSGAAAAIGYTAGSGQVQSSVFDLSGANPVIMGGAVFNGRINDLFEHNGSLYAFGRFTQVGLRTCRGAARFTGSEWLPLVASGFDVYPVALASFGTALWAGGNFGTIAGTDIFYLARRVDGVWQPVSTPGPGGPVTALSFYAPNPTGGPSQYMIVGGIFTQAGSVAATNIAQYKYTGGILDILPMGSGVNGPPRVFASINTSIAHNDLLVGGDFTTANGATVNHVARWTGSAWQALGSGVNGNVYALSVFGGQIIAGGSFTTAGGGASPHVAAWNGSAWVSMGAGLNDTVRSLAIYNGELYAGGEFTASGASPVARFAKWNGSAWVSPGAGVDGAIWAMRIVDSDLLVGGNFASAVPTTGVLLNHLALWNGSSFRRFNQGIDNTVLALATNGSDVYAAATVPPYIFRATPANPPSVDAVLASGACIDNMNVFLAQTSCDNSTFRWRRDGQFLTDGINPGGAIAVGVNSSRLNYFPSSDADSGLFDCQITCPCGTAISDPVDATFASPPRIILQPVAGSFCNGSTQDLAVFAEGEHLFYTWYRNGTPILSTTSPLVTLADQTIADAGSYYCEVSNSCGTVTSQSVQRTAVTAPVFTLQPTDRSICQGRSAAFTIAASNSVGATYQWYRNNTLLTDRPPAAGISSIAGSRTASLTIGNAGAADAGYYSCRISTGCTISSNQALLTITTTSCCRGDFNNSGAITVQDLLDYLTAYFANQPAADFNASGSVSIQDLFDYLTAYFAGC